MFSLLHISNSYLHLFTYLQVACHIHENQLIEKCNVDLKSIENERVVI